MFTRALVKTPCRNMVNGITHARLGVPDYPLALAQHERYVQALESCGLEVMVLEPDEAFPDSTFIEDTCLVTPHGAILTNPGAASRKGETKAVELALLSLGLTIDKITDPGTLDAGDIMMEGSHYYVGLSQRTNREGFLQLTSLLERYGYTCSSISLETVLHLKTGISYLENNCLLAWGEFLTKPELQKFTLLPVVGMEAYAANAVWINGRVLVAKGFPKTREMIEKQGYATLEVDVSEFRKLDGGLSCLSLRF